VLTTRDEAAWREALPASASVLGSLEYVRLEEHFHGRIGRLFVLEVPGGRIAYPMFLRPVPPVLPHAAAPGWDTSTPEYTGPLYLGEGQPDPAAFRQAFEAWCEDEGIVAEFAHLNPWKARTALLPGQGLAPDRELVYIDLTQGEDALWRGSLSANARRQTRHAWDADIEVRRATSEADVLAFHRLHQATMDRREALSRYHLPAAYFLELHRTLGEHAFIMLAEHGGVAVAGGLYLQDDTDVFWHLSALDLDHAQDHPVHAYHFEAMRLCARTGRKRLLCGGGYQPGDGIFRFKAGFSPLRVTFNVYRRVHDTATYGSLLEAWCREHPGQNPAGDYFPSYRAVPLEEVSAGLPRSIISS